MRPVHLSSTRTVIRLNSRLKTNPQLSCKFLTMIDTCHKFLTRILLANLLDQSHHQDLKDLVSHWLKSSWNSSKKKDRSRMTMRAKTMMTLTGVKSRDDEPALALLMQAEDEDLVIHSHLPLVDREDHVNM